MRPLAVLALLLVLPALAACEREAAPVPVETPPPPAIPFRLDGTLRFLRADGTPITGISIEIAETDSARARGLMERDVIPDQTGMLFIMPGPEVQGFYMANTPRSLDIMFFGPDSTLINVAKYTTPFSTATVQSETPALFVVETAAGFADQFGLVPGDRITWARTPAGPPAYARPEPAAAAPAAP